MTEIPNPFRDIEAFDKIERSTLTDEERVKYDHALRIYRDRLAYEDAIEQDKKEALAQGKAEGIAEGIAQGKAEGIALGTQKVAIKLKGMGMSLESISDATGLSIEEIEKL